MKKSPNQRFYLSDEQYREQIERVLTRKQSANEITQADVNIIRLFLSEIRATRGITESRSSKLVSLLTGLRRWVPPFEQMKTSDVYQAIDLIHHNGFTQNTESDNIRMLKRLCLWLCENDMASPGLDCKKIQKIRPPGYDNATKDVSDLLSPEQVMSIIQNAGNVKNQAIISTLYEGGMRIGEIGNLQWNQVKFFPDHVAINTDFKTGKSRTIPLYNSLGYLKQWYNQYPGTPDPSSFVFISATGRPYTYAGLVKLIRVAAGRASIDKHITSHIFRHSRITHLIKEGWKESVIKKMMWGSVESDMFKVYLHLCDDDVSDEAAERMGIRKPGRPTNESKKLEPRQCMTCGTVNPFTSRFCDQCGTPLTEEALHDREYALQLASEIATKKYGSS